MIEMNAAGICYEREGDLISPDDIYIGMYRFFDEPLRERMLAKSGLTREQKNRYAQQARDVDYVPIDSLVKDLSTIARNSNADFDPELLYPVLRCFRQNFEEKTVYVKTALKGAARNELYIRTGHPSGITDFIGMAAKCGLQDLTDHPMHRLYRSICRKAPTKGTLVDLKIDGTIQKLYAFHIPHAVPLKRIIRCPSIPPSLAKNIPLLKEWGFGHFTISGVDYINQSMNLYFHLIGPDNLSGGKAEKILATLGFPLPSAKVLKLIEKAGMVYFTFSKNNPEIERVCFTYITSGNPGEIYDIEPSARAFIESPVKSRKRTVFFGLAFNSKGYFVKPEIDYKGTANIPGVISHPN